LTMSDRACFAPAFLQVRIRDRLTKALLRKHLSDEPEALCEDVNRRMFDSLLELSLLVDLSFIEPYLKTSAANPSEPLKLIRPESRLDGQFVNAA